MGATALLLRAAFSRRRIGSHLMALLVLALATAGLSAGLAVRANSAASVDAAFGIANGPDLVAYTDRHSTPRLLRKLESIPAARAAVPVPVIDAQARIDGETVELDLRGLADPDAEINAPQVTAGRLPAGAGEVLFDAGVARERGVEPGDTVELRRAGRSTRLVVTGLAYDFTDCFFPNCDPGHAWVLHDTFVAIAGDTEPTDLVAIDLDDPASSPRAATLLESTLGGALLGVNDWLDTRGDLLVEIDFFGAFLGVFGVFVLIGAALVIAAAISARTIARRRSVAICKAVGCSQAQIAGAIVIEHAVLAAAGSLAGSLAGVALAPRLRIGSTRILAGDSPAPSLATIAVPILAVVVLTVLATLVPAVRTARTDVVDGLAARTRLRPSGSGLAGWLPAPVALGSRSATAQPVRTALSALAIALAVVAAVVTTGIDRSVDRLLADPALTGDPYDAIVVPFESAGAEQIERALAVSPGVVDWFTFTDSSAVIDGERVHIRGIGGDLHAARYEIGAGRSLAAPGEAIVGYGLMRAHGWELGDAIALDVDGTSMTTRLVGWYRETEDSGEILQLTLDDLRRAQPAASVAFAVSGTVDQTLDALATVELNQSDESQTRPFSIAINAMTALIAAIVIAHLLATMLAAARQRAHRAYVLRAMGMSNQALHGEALAHAASVAVIGTGIGLAVGWFAQRGLGNLLTAALGAGPGLTVGPSPVQLLTISVVAVVCCSLAGLAVALVVRPDQRRVD